MVTIYTTARNVEYYTNNHEALWSNFSGPGSVAEHDRERVFHGRQHRHREHHLHRTPRSSPTRNALGVAPVAVWENGSLMQQRKFGAVASDQTPGSWYYDGTYLYIHASDGSNVATNGKTYDYVTASSPTYHHLG